MVPKAALRSALGCYVAAPSGRDGADGQNVTEVIVLSCLGVKVTNSSVGINLIRVGLRRVIGDAPSAFALPRSSHWRGDQFVHRGQRHCENFHGLLGTGKGDQ